MLGKENKGYTITAAHVAVASFLVYILTGWTGALDVCIFALLIKLIK